MTIFHHSEMTREELARSVSLAKSCEITQAEMDEMSPEEYSEFLAICSIYDI